MTVLIVILALIAGFQFGAGWVIERGYGPFLWGFTHPFSRRPESLGAAFESKPRSTR